MYWLSWFLCYHQTLSSTYTMDPEDFLKDGEFVRLDLETSAESVDKIAAEGTRWRLCGENNFMKQNTKNMNKKKRWQFLKAAVHRNGRRDQRNCRIIGLTRKSYKVIMWDGVNKMCWCASDCSDYWTVYWMCSFKIFFYYMKLMLRLPLFLC